MNLTSTSFATKTRTWLLIAALTALLIEIGALLGGMFLYAFVALAVVMNVANILQFSLLFGGDEDSGPPVWIGLIGTIIFAPLERVLRLRALDGARAWSRSHVPEVEFGMSTHVEPFRFLIKRNRDGRHRWSRGTSCSRSFRAAPSTCTLR